MFGLLRNQSRSAAGAIGYVTVGTLMVIWAGLWYYYFLMPEPNPPAWQKFACVGTIMSGFAIGSIGLLFGLIGRGAKGADTTVGIAPVSSEVPVASAGEGSVGVVSTPVVSAAAPVTATPINYAKR
jgi:hypothetical protein